MDITNDGWLVGVKRVPGPADKIYSARNSVSGYIPHSAVGYYPGWANRLFSTTRDSNGRYTSYAAASVHGWISYDGTIIQHYSFYASCWASGNFPQNTSFVAFENEGGYSPYNEPLTDGQNDANIAIIDALSRWKNWKPSRPSSSTDPSATIYQHKEAVKIWGGRPTACGSDRFPFTLWLRELENINMVDEKARQLMSVAALGHELSAAALAGKPVDEATKRALLYLLSR